MVRQRSSSSTRWGPVRLAVLAAIGGCLGACLGAAGSSAAQESGTQEPEKALSRAAEPAIVRPPEGPAITLAPQPSGSGFRYADETRELRGKGRDVTWTDAGTPPVVCTERIAPPGGTEPN